MGFSPFGSYRNIIEEINPHALSKALKKELKNHGINTKFHIGLFSNNRLVVKEKGIEKVSKSYEAICNYIQSELKW